MRLAKLDELRLQEAMGTSGLSIVEEEAFEAEDFELKIVRKEDSKVELKIESQLFIPTRRS